MHQLYIQISFVAFETFFPIHLQCLVSVIVSEVSIDFLVSICFKFIDVKEEVIQELKLYTCTVIDTRAYSELHILIVLLNCDPAPELLRPDGLHSVKSTVCMIFPSVTFQIC